jgi:DNA-binding NarL/FixJ family response regulator
MSDVIRVKIVDDHDIVRSGLVNTINTFDDLELVGRPPVANRRSRCATLNPDVILMDLVMPTMTGVSVATQHIHAAYPDIRIVVRPRLRKTWSMGRWARAISYLLGRCRLMTWPARFAMRMEGGLHWLPEATQVLISGRPARPRSGMT